MTPVSRSPSDSSDDPELLRRARAGDRAALHALVLRHADWLRAVVRRRLHPSLRREFDSADMLQDVMVGLLKTTALQTAKDPDHFKALLARAVERDVLDALRHAGRARRARAREHTLHGDSSWAARPPRDSVTRPSQHAIRDERVAWIRLAMQRMAPAEREILKLRVWEGLEFQQIAERLELSPDATRMRLNRALKRLAQTIEALKARG